MLALTSGYILLQLLIFLAGLLPSIPVSLEPEASRIKYLKDFLGDVTRERPTDTLLLMKRRQDNNCPLKEFHPHHLTPTLRLDESTIISVKDHFNSEAIAVVCMSDLADSMLLTSLAKDLHRMRESRVIIWLQDNQSNPKKYLDVITDQARTYNFLSLIVLHSTSSNAKYSIIGYRLHPFPTPNIERIMDLKIRPIFPDFWKDFGNKTAVALPSNFAPSSYLSRDKRTGKMVLSGYMDTLIMEFAKKHNINLQIKQSLKTVNGKDTTRLVLNGEVDLTMLARVCISVLECAATLEVEKIFIVVPCGKVIGIGEVYRGLRNNLLVVLGVYLIFSIVNTLIVAASCRIFEKSYRFSYLSLFINLNAFSGALGLPININRNRRSISLHQIIMVMSIFSLIVNCFFNANLSTLLTKRPENHSIKNFKELRDSGIKVIFEESYRDVTENDMRNNFTRIHNHQAVFKQNNERVQMIFSQNPSDAHQIYTKIWTALNFHQRHYKSKTLCRPPGLNVYEMYPVASLFKQNSVYIQAWNYFVRWTYDLGLKRHWNLVAIRKMVEFTNHGQSLQHPTPLNFDDLQWIWKLLGLCYAASFLVFIGEFCLEYWKRRLAARISFIV